MSKPTANQIAATLRCCSDSNSELLCIDCAFSVGVSCLKNNCYDAAADMLEEQEARIRELEAQVDAERWHDLLKNPEDLPELIPTSVGTAYSEALAVWTTDRKIVTAIYTHEGNFWGDGDFWDVEGKVIAWRYIMPPEEEE